MKIYTLKETKTGVGACLNGKIFNVKKDDKGCAVFIDLATEKVIWLTTEVQEKDITGDTLRFTTKSGSVYELVNVLSIIPTALPNEDPFKIVNHIVNLKPKGRSHHFINYGDGCDKTEFEFKSDISKEEFIKYLVANDYRIHEKKGCSEDHSVIEGSGNKWTYTWVHACTD